MSFLRIAVAIAALVAVSAGAPAATYTVQSYTSGSSTLYRLYRDGVSVVGGLSKVAATTLMQDLTAVCPAPAPSTKNYLLAE